MLASPGIGVRPLPPPPGRDSLPPPPQDNDDLLSPNSDADDWTHPSATAAALEHDGVLDTNPRQEPNWTSPSTNLTAAKDSTSKRSNPLTDLVESEKIYVDLMAGVIRKVASAWSRSNFPPPELDTMFRSIEAVYKVNRTFLAKLKDIGPNPSSPKALGDLLMRWIDDLEAPYTRYCSGYLTSFDTWELLQNVPRLPDVLADLSEQIPPPSTDDGQPPNWTLDSLFLLPRARLKYYKKLYARLLKSTQPGRSDHRLLVGANDKLETLLSMVEERASLRPGINVPNNPEPTSAPLNPQQKHDSDIRTSVGSSVRGSSLSGSERRSGDTAVTSVGRTPSLLTNGSVLDLERRLSTDRVLDIFTMNRKKCRLQMSPPGLPFVRSLRISGDVTIRFTPRSTGLEVVDPLAHIILLTDLFLVCTRMTSDERADAGPDGPDMWLSYPPLAGKHLKVSDLPGPEDNVFQVQIMKKETLFIYAESRFVKEQMIKEFQDCTDMAASVSPAVKGAQSSNPSPVNGFPRPPSAPLEYRPNPYMHPPPGSYGPGSFDPSRQSLPEFSMPPGPTSYNNQNPDILYQPPARGSSVANPVMNGMPYRPRSAGGPNPHHLSINTTQFLPPRPLQDTLIPPPSPPTRGSSPGYYDGQPPRSPSTRSLASTIQYDEGPLPPVPRYPPHYAGNFSPSHYSYSQYGPPGGHPGPYASGGPGPMNINNPQQAAVDPDISPPTSPVNTGPVTNNITAQMKCKVFLQQHHAQWKSLGNAKLKLYHQMPTNVKQIVVEADTKEHPILISTIVLTDGVERVGKTGVAIELSDKGVRAGVVYMVQLRNETSASGLFNSLLAGSDRATATKR